MKKMACNDNKWGQEEFFPTDPDLADILSRMDLDFVNFYFLYSLDPKFLDVQVPKFWISRSQISGIQRFLPQALIFEHNCSRTWPALEDFLLFYGFLVIPWPFWGSGGVLK